MLLTSAAGEEKKEKKKIDLLQFITALESLASIACVPAKRLMQAADLECSTRLCPAGDGASTPAGGMALAGTALCPTDSTLWPLG